MGLQLLGHVYEVSELQYPRYTMCCRRELGEVMLSARHGMA